MSTRTWLKRKINPRRFKRVKNPRRQQRLLMRAFKEGAYTLTTLPLEPATPIKISDWEIEKFLLHRQYRLGVPKFMRKYGFRVPHHEY